MKTFLNIDNNGKNKYFNKLDDINSIKNKKRHGYYSEYKSDANIMNSSALENLSNYNDNNLK